MPSTTSAADSFGCWDGFDVIYEERPAYVRSSSERSSSSTLAAGRPTALERSRSPQCLSDDHLGTLKSPLTRDFTSINRLWDTLRQKKERQMAKSPPKVKSLEPPPIANHPTVSSDPAPAQHKPAPQLKKRKSHVSFRESRDGRTVTAAFDLPGVKKDQAHVSFRGNHLIVTWETVRITEKEEGGRLVREREEKKFHRTIPLPEGTKFEEIKARMDGRYLTLTYPNMRSVRVEPRHNTARHVEPRCIEPQDVESSEVYEY
ncbi:hypothetical protein BJ138DRAFT_1141400 [Hygrophoropsis aurantiaca]|uniref:Uncharacterized protein n=1 Tax=Hygrophoropsis aurantiaca TaxID=72124 RepID=A0ACB8ARL0_9AGAM|nr:hypothetical protein BJ138DRAFT_1141400 [Hygrophoropsis aurantiaca]